jgi:hypothetical protein
LLASSTHLTTGADHGPRTGGLDKWAKIIMARENEKRKGFYEWFYFCEGKKPVKEKVV